MMWIELAQQALCPF
uniref:Uncharacterized protein n=1 Tax=Arundo donax TaxID=35708 RepID=A0A0A8YI40_ARUDO